MTTAAMARPSNLFYQSGTIRPMLDRAEGIYLYDASNTKLPPSDYRKMA